MAQRKRVDYQRHLSYPAALAELKRQAERIRTLEFEVNEAWCFNYQQFLDCAQIALHHRFGFGPARNAQFREELEKETVKWMRSCIKEVRETEQGKNCFDFVYTQGKMDEALEAAVGEILPWEARYDTGRLLDLQKRMRRGQAELYDK